MDGIPQEDVYVRYSGVYHPYSHGDLSDTRAPRGYKPFYISHVGRHGSCYPVDRKYVYNGLEPFLKAEAAGILTDEGRKGIATRMATRFPSVFEGRDSVFAISTYKQRCIMSAAYFMSALTAKHPRLRVGLAAGDKYYDMLSREDKAVGFNEAFDVWDSSVMMPMGTNLQMIFYRHPRKDEVLVKLLFNEQETSIPAIGPGPYYRWSELRKYLAGLTR